MGMVMFFVCVCVVFGKRVNDGVLCCILSMQLLRLMQFVCLLLDYEIVSLFRQWIWWVILVEMGR